MKFLDCVIRCMARNQVDRRNLLDSKMVPAVMLHLVAAGRALPVHPAEPAERAVHGAAATRADEALGPARSDERGLTEFVAAVALHEFRHRKAGLDLDAIHGHDAPQELVSSSSLSTGSWDEPYRAW